MFKVIWRDEAKVGLARIDRTIAEKIVEKVENYLVKNPSELGEPLFYDWKGHYRYRYGDYRIIYQVKELEILIIVVKVGHRKEIY